MQTLMSRCVFYRDTSDTIYLQAAFLYGITNHLAYLSFQRHRAIRVLFFKILTGEFLSLVLQYSSAHYGMCLAHVWLGCAFAARARLHLAEAILIRDERDTAIRKPHVDVIAPNYKDQHVFIRRVQIGARAVYASYVIPLCVFVLWHSLSFYVKRKKS